jgi:hypothetical protein
MEQVTHLNKNGMISSFILVCLADCVEKINLHT